jgi:hypothetical protein
VTGVAREAVGCVGELAEKLRSIAVPRARELTSEAAESGCRDGDQHGPGVEPAPTPRRDRRSGRRRAAEPLIATSGATPA